MPLPIQRIKDEDSNFRIDYSFLNNLKNNTKDKKIVVAGDKDADLLFKLWTNSQKISEDVYNIRNSNVKNDEILRLKTHGFLTGGTEEIRFTGKAKAVITTMVLGENNKFTKQQKNKSYTEILASISLRGKKGYRIPKIAANYNLINLTYPHD